jgi:tetratricopeptide (TPR) repeat protein
MRGRYDDAGAYLSRARAIATSPVTQAAIDAKTGELAFKRGDVRAAADALERALPLLGRRVPRSPAAMAAATLLLVLVQLAHMLLPRRLVGRRRLEDGEADLLAARIFSRLAYANWFLRGQMATFWAHLSELNLAERYPPTRELAQACSEHSISVTGLPRIFFRRGVRYAERGLAIRRALGDVWGQGQSLNFYGMLLYAFGRYEEALDRFREALRLLRSTGDRWEANVAAAHIAFCHYRLGALREAVAECRRVHHDGHLLVEVDPPRVVVLQGVGARRRDPLARVAQAELRIRVLLLRVAARDLRRDDPQEGEPERRRPGARWRP